jgi:hypothetical protein
LEVDTTERPPDDTARMVLGLIGGCRNPSARRSAVPRSPRRS